MFRFAIRINPLRFALATGFASLLSIPVFLLSAQTNASISGIVTAETGIVLAGAAVSVDGTQLQALTNERGRFVLNGVTPGRMTVRARRLGFAPTSLDIDVPSSDAQNLDFKLPVVIQDLQPVVVRGQKIRYSGRLAGYYERLERQNGGVFITREEIESVHSSTLGLLLQRVPGITTRARGAATGVRMRDRSCRPLVWLDGNAMIAGDVDLDSFTPNSIEGIEIYLGSTTAPARYTWVSSANSCGTILLWSRGSDTDVPHETITSPAELEALVASLSVYTADQVDRVAQLESDPPLSVRYPPSLFAAHQPGSVVAEFVVDTSGHIEPETFGVVSSTHPLFTDAVRRAIGTVSYTPAVRQGKSVRQLVHQPFQFSAQK